MMPKTALPAVKKLMTVYGGPSKAKPPGGDGQKRPSRDLGSRVSLLGGGPVHTGRKRSRTQATRQRPANTQEEERKSRAKAPPMNKTATLGKTLTPKVPPVNKTVTLGKTLTPKAPPVNKTATLGKTLTPKAPPVPQNPTVSKDDKEEVTKLQEEVESLRKALELMGEQLESKLMDIWEELKSERERHQLLEVQMNLRTKESLTPISSPTQPL
uniref:SH3 domain containing 21 n=1 Tax=Pipistrellus kuhlii TaxID=59472 RepID=A0A7J7ZJ53_PIPKU|nr:hypothetical protein mPipKuh1_009520 [Pipistrellus kuhlii]